MFKGLALAAMLGAGMFAATPGDANVWIKYISQAPLAACLVWFMLRLERILKEHTKSINNLVRSQMVAVMTFHGTSEAAKTQARNIIDDLEDQQG